MTRKVLGRGLDALIPVAISASPAGEATLAPAVETEEALAQGGDPGERVHQIPVESIVPNPRQPRREFDPDKLNELAQSIRELGMLEPVIIRALNGDRYELVAGERRFRAAQQAGLTSVPALIRGFEGRQSLEVALIENLQREDLNPVDEARAYLRLAEEFGRTHAEISRDVGKDRSTVSNLIRLLRLPESVLAEVSRGTLTPGHARVLLAFESAEEQASLARTMIAEGWSVRRAEQFLTQREQANKPETTPAPTAARQQKRDPEVVRVEEALRYALGTQVHLHHTGNSGKIEILYSTRDELERMLALLGVQIH